MNIHIFWSYWWLIFPFGFLFMSFIRMVLNDNYQRRKLEIFKSYLDQGKDIPDALKRELDR